MKISLTVKIICIHSNVEPLFGDESCGRRKTNEKTDEEEGKTWLRTDDTHPRVEWNMTSGVEACTS